MKIIEQIIFRTPLFPYSFISNPDSFKYISESKEFQEASYLASPVLHKELNKHKAGLIKDEKERKKVNSSLYKYLVRASARCTPFGLFAGLATGKWDKKNAIFLDNDIQKKLNRKTRLDMNVVCMLAQWLGKQRFIEPYLKFYSNNSLYKTGNSYRYVEYIYHLSKRVYRLSKVDYSDYLEAIFEAAINGICKEELVTLLVKKDIDLTEASEVVKELIDMQLLVNELEPTTTGEDFFERVLNILQTISNKYPSNELQETIITLLQIKKLINELDINKTNEVGNYQIIYEKLKTILPHINETNIFQTDLFKLTKNATLNEEIKQNITLAIKFLDKISVGYRNQNLEGFKKRFQDRYQEEEIPLLQVLDSESGLGYPNKDIEGINDLVDDIRIYKNTNSNSSVNLDHLQTILFKILIKSVKENKYCIELTDDDFIGIDYTNKNTPHSLSVMFKVINAESNKIYFESAGWGASAMNLLGRFAYGDKAILDITKVIAKHEEEQVKGKILAEIVHLPQDRTGNILSRPVIREYEIPYLAKSAVLKEYQLDVNDLNVSVKNNIIILRSKRLNKEIIPRLSNAHNFRYNSLPVYYFLCDLQLQYFHKPTLSFNWGALSNQFTFLPRVEYKNIILSPAKWQLKKTHFESLLNKKQNDQDVLKSFFTFKEKYELPRLFLLAEGDNELLIDTKLDVAIYAFIDALKNKQSIIIEEFLFDLEKPLVKDERGNGYTNECIAIVLNDENTFAETKIQEVKKDVAKRHFTIGSEWLYYKIYSGVKTADHILKEKINSITQSLLKNKIIDKWFFVRYSDPNIHLRIRLHIKDLSKYGEILKMVKTEFEGFIDEGIIFKIQIDEYTRELERYGDSTIELSENLFYFDSVCCISALNLFDTHQGERIRWQYALKATDQLLDDFKFNLQEKYNFINELSQSFFKEHGGKKELKLQLDSKFRKLRRELKDILSNELGDSEEMYLLIGFLNERSSLNKNIIDELYVLKKSNNLSINIHKLLGSYIHMMHNRIFMAKQRTNEFVIYDILSRHYKSDLARLNKDNSLSFKSVKKELSINNGINLVN